MSSDHDSRCMSAGRVNTAPFNTRRDRSMEPMALFGIQFTLSLFAYALIAAWYARPRLARLTPIGALVPLLWVHVFRIAGGTILAPGAVDPGVPDNFRQMVGVGDLVTAALALVALLALRFRPRGAVALVWLVLVVGAIDTTNAVIQSIRYSVFTYPLGLNWVIVTMYVPALVVSSVLILWQLLRHRQNPET